MSLEHENYFTCNLGQAATYGTDAEFTTISDFVHRQARDYPALPALGYFEPVGTSLRPSILYFKDIREQCDVLKDSISRHGIPNGQVVALMVRTLPDFLFAFLALTEIGSPVLLIAPQCTPKASAQLCKQCKASVLYQGDSAPDLIRSLEEAASEIDFDLKSYKLEIQKDTVAGRKFTHSGAPEDTAYLFHTSGTSTGIPKPIPQTHRAGAGVQHRFDGSKSATFTTTPLYHGGMADLFRAWTSNALIWLFPGEHLPITQKNVVKCLDIARQATIDKGVPQVQYFSSVPYVLESMSSDTRALEHLLSMEVVGVGGAALPTEVGDALVTKGVQLISRFGSAECGFLMSSHRDYENDSEWRYLRPKESMKHLAFEPREDGLYELVVLRSWPFMAKSNREDGSFATSDLFERHQDKADAWRYHSRADSQLTLVTGKKFDPAPVESALAASSPFIADVLVFGNDRPFPGALVFRSSESSGFSDDRLLDEVWPAMEKLNSESQSHTRISRNMLCPMTFNEQCLEKSSKGTVIRRKAEERYKHQIEEAYTESTERSDIPDGDVARSIRDIVQSTLKSSGRQSGTLGETTDLFAHGVDSIASIQIRSKLRGLIPRDSGPLPATFVEDSGTIERLGKAIIAIRQGNQSEAQAETPFEIMQELVSEHSMLKKPLSISSEPAVGRQETKTILLTGSTGSLGCNLLHQLLSSKQVKHVHLLVRGSSPEASRQRLVDGFASRHLELPTDFVSRVSIHSYTIPDIRSGMSEDAYGLLVKEVDLIIHLAWPVNFLMPLSGFSPHFGGLQSLLGLALAHADCSADGKGARFIFCSSTASVASFEASPDVKLVPEDIMARPQVSGSIGYSRSKWVAEAICSEVSGAHSELNGLIDVVRVGQVSGHSENGVWNASEAYPLLLSSAKLTGCLPELHDEKLAWIPVDVAATAFAQLAIAGHEQQPSKKSDPTKTTRVFHLLNSQRKTKWNSLVTWLKEDEEFDIVPVQDWLQKLEQLEGLGAEGEMHHPCLKLLHFWKEAYGTHKVSGGDEERLPSSNHNESHDDCEYEMIGSKQSMPVLDFLTPLDKKYVLRLWNWIKVNI